MNEKADLTISVITATLNNADTIADCIQSVQGQTRAAEHIIIDGASTDATLKIVKRHAPSSRIVSEPDNGIYDALNKGIRMATGEVIGVLHADDVYADENVLDKVARCMIGSAANVCYGDLVYVNRRNTADVVRYWKSSVYRAGLFERGWMPPHPTFFVRKRAYDRYGSYDCGFRIAADYELMLRFLVKYGISSAYIPEVLVKMRMGGSSNRSLRNMTIKTSEDYQAWSVNGLSRKWYTIPLKNLSKLPQFLRRK